jgi:hypothetical protein
MDPNQVFFFMLSGFNPFMPQLYNSEVQPMPKPQITSKKYHRTWKKHQVEEVFSSATKYCQETGKTIEDLSLSDFELISSCFEQSAEQIMVKVNEISKSGTLRPGIWSGPEDDLLTSVLKKGVEKWGQIANLLNKEVHKGLKIRTGKQCKERWNNYLNPDVNRGPWTESEDIKALESYKVHGNKWSLIARSIHNRTESSVKNRIKSLLNKIKQDLNTMDDLNHGIDRVIVKKQIAIRDNLVESASPRSGLDSVVLPKVELTFSQACFEVEGDSKI